MVDVTQLESKPIDHKWYRLNLDGTLATDTITFDTKLTAEQMETILGNFRQADGYSPLGTVFDGFSNRFCLEQDDSEAEVESDEALPEFLDTFEVKEGD